VVTSFPIWRRRAAQVDNSLKLFTASNPGGIFSAVIKELSADKIYLTGNVVATKPGAPERHQ
jgi:hypothetical protein